MRASDCGDIRRVQLVSKHRNPFHGQGLRNDRPERIHRRQRCFATYDDRSNVLRVIRFLQIRDEIVNDLRYPALIVI